MSEILGSGKSVPKGDFHFVGLTILPGDGRVIDDGSLVVKGGVIAALGTAQEVKAKWDHLPRVEAKGYLATPGLVNAHTHAAMGFFRGLGHDQEEMIETFLFPAEKSLTPELIEPLAYSYVYAGLVAGVTTFSDHYYFVEGVGRALERFGLRGVIGETVADLGGAFPGQQSFEAWRRKIGVWPFSSRVTPAVAPHAADTVSGKLLRELGDFARSHRLPLHLHLSQTSGERQRVFAASGLSPVAFAEQCGLLGERTLAVHLVSADKEDVKRLAGAGVTAGICPASQIIYESLAPLDLLFAANVPVALGTDCAASNDTADLLQEMRLMGLLARDRGIAASARSPAALFAMGSSNGAQVLGLGKTVGCLAAGYAADILFLEPDLAALPMQKPYVDLIYSLASRHVRHVMVDGKFVLYNRRTTLVDEEDLSKAYQEAVSTIRSRLGFT